MTPFITVIIPCYNGAKYVHRCLDSIRRQSFRDLEVLLIDDGSTDDSVALAAEYTEVTVISNDSNRGLAYTRNRGVQLAQGEYVHFLDVDDRVSSDYYLRMAESARTTGADIVIGGRSSRGGTTTISVSRRSRPTPSDPSIMSPTPVAGATRCSTSSAPHCFGSIR